MEVGHKALQVNKTTGRGNLPQQWMALVAPCSDSRSVCVGHRACVWNSGCRVTFVRQLISVCAQLEMCARPVLRAGVRCAEVGFFRLYCPDDGRDSNDGTHSCYNREEFTDSFLLGWKGLWLTAQ